SSGLCGREPMRRRIGGSVVGAAMLALGTVFGVTSAWADLSPVPPTGEPGYLELAADPYPAEFVDLAPGRDGLWLIEARLRGAEDSTLALELAGEEDLVAHSEGLQVAVSSCADPFEVTANDLSTATCPSGAQPVVPQARLADVGAPRGEHRWELPHLEAASPRQFLVTLSLVESSARTEALSGRIGVGLYASGEDAASPAAPEPRPSMPELGVSALPVLLIAGGAIVLGASARRSRWAER
ncbi:MAG TPA: hypothetical protein VK039_10205, partial [Brevibacterium sp.]|nr:hypothetical protein [Brevibacterium sp.]